MSTNQMPETISKEFFAACEQARTASNGEYGPISIREILSWFGSARRGQKIVGKIKDALEMQNVHTDPDFNDPSIDGECRLRSNHVRQHAFQSNGQKQENQKSIETNSEAPSYVGASLHISRLAAAGRKPQYVAPDHPIDEVVTRMIHEDFSQMPVCSTLRDVKGVISWRSIGRQYALGPAPVTAKDAMMDAIFINSSDRLLDAIDVIAEHQYALVKSRSKDVVGIVTATDLTMEFRRLTEPFLLIGEIEDQLRRILGNLEMSALKELKNPADPRREVERVNELSFGEYRRAFESKWDALKERSGLRLSRKVLLDSLERVNGIRNEVMHFDPDPLGDSEMASLRSLLRLLQEESRVQRRESKVSASFTGSNLPDGITTPSSGTSSPISAA
jgi:CBS domain-containing protein